MKKKLTNLLLASTIVILTLTMAVKTFGFSTSEDVASSDSEAHLVEPAAANTKSLTREVKEINMPEVLKHFKEITYNTTKDKVVIKEEIVACKDYEFRLISLMNNEQLASERPLVEEELSKVRSFIVNYNNEIVEIEAEEARIKAEQARKAAEEAQRKKEEQARIEKSRQVTQVQNNSTSNKNQSSNNTSNSGQYPVATKVWRYMKDVLGWNDYVAAGVMGNMMAEVGGQTLNLDVDLYSSGGAYYGICQWAGQYYPAVFGTGLDYQLDFLKNTVQKELNTYGYLFRSGMNYSQFISLTDAEDAAMAFAKAYERCGSGSYGVRRSNALKALNYFSN